MPAARSVSVPSYRLHKQSGQAVVTLRDQSTGRRNDVLLGAHGTSESRAEYARVIGEWEGSGRRVRDRQTSPDLTLNELAAAFWPFVETHYKNHDGTPTKEVDEFKLSLKPLKELYGHTIAIQFGPLRLKALRENMIGAGLSRVTVNQRIWRVKRLFAWGVENELLPAPVWHALLAVKGLQKGRSTAREAITRAADHFRSRGLREAIIEKHYFVTEALRIIAVVAGDNTPIAFTSANSDAAPVWMATTIEKLPSREYDYVSKMVQQSGGSMLRSPVEVRENR